MATEAVGTAEWTGDALGPLLAEAGLRDDVVEVVFAGSTAASRAASAELRAQPPRAEALGPDALLDYAINGRRSAAARRAVRLVTGWYGMADVKWLAGIRR